MHKRKAIARHTEGRGSEVEGIPKAALILFLLLASCAPSAKRGPAVFFPSPPEKARIQYLTYFSGAEDVLPERGAFSKMIFGDAKIEEVVKKPYGVAIYKGAIYVCDTKGGVINIFDLEERRYGFLGFRGRGKLLKPINIAIDSRGYKYVADANRKEIVVFDGNDDFLRTLSADKFIRPVGVAIGKDKIFVCDSKACKIHVFDRESFEFLYSFGDKGAGPGQFAFPTNVAVDSDGNLYVSDTINGRVQKLDEKGNPLSAMGRLGDMPGEFARPKGLAVDREGRLYIVDAAFENVQIFNSEGKLLLFFSGAGNKPGELNLPAQIVVDYDNVNYFRKFADKNFELDYIILVTSQYGPRKVNVFGFGHYKI